MAAATISAMPAASSAGGARATTMPPCTSDVYEDVADVVLLTTVFVIGWVIFNKLAVFLGLRTTRGRKAAPWAPDAAIPEPRKSCQEAIDDAEPCSPAAVGKGAHALDLAAPAAPLPAKASGEVGFDFDMLCTPTCSKASDTPSTVTTMPSGYLDGFGDLFRYDALDELASDLSTDFDLASSDMEVSLSMDSDVSECTLEGLDGKIRDAASRSDLAACWRAWRGAVGPAAAAAPASLLTGPTCSVLAAAVRRGAAASADADLALEAAVSAVHAELAEAALLAGSRLRDAAWLARACGRLDAVGVPIRPEHFASLARAYGRESRADLAVDLWRDRCATLGLATEQGECADTFEEPLPLPELYAAALEACVAASDFSSAWRLAAASDWRAPATADGQAAMLALAKWLAKHQGVGVARRCIDGVRRAGGRPGPHALRALFAASARAGDMKQASELFDEVAASSRAALDFGTYSLMVRGFGAIGDVQGALRFFHEMRQQGLRPDAALFDAILGACAARNLLGLAEEVLADMEASGARPTSATLAALVRLHAARGAPAAAAAVFEELPRRHGFEPDARAYHALITACLSAGRTDLALDAFSTMSRKGRIPSAKTYEALTTASLRSGDLPRAAALVEDALGLPAVVPPPPAPADGESEPSHDGGLEQPPQAAAPEQPQEQPQPRAAGASAVLERRVLEELLELAGRRREASIIGMPLLAKLQQAGVSVSSRVAEALAGAAAAEEEQRAGAPSLRRRGAARCGELHQWRQGFGRTEEAVEAAM